MTEAGKVGLLLPNDGFPVASFRHLHDLTVQAEKSKFNSIWVADHLLAPPGLSAAFGTKGIFEAITTLAALSQVSKKMLLGTSVCVLPMRHPLLLANQITALDHASNGRVVLGFGVGGYPPEYDALNLPYDKRGKMVDEEIMLLKSIWSGSDLEFAGEFYRMKVTGVEPKPIQTPHPPLYSGGEANKTLERVARLADGWAPWGLSAERMEEGIAKITSLCEKNGRNPKNLRFGVGFYGGITKDNSIIRKRIDEVAPYFRIHHSMETTTDVVKSRTLIGTPEECVQRLKRYCEVGITQFIVKFIPFTREEESIRLCSEKVIPQIS